MLLFLQRGNKILGSDDGSSHQLREHRQVGKKVAEVSRWFHLAPIHVDGVTHRLKRVEANADGQNQLKRRNLEGRSKETSGTVEIGYEKVQVFKKCQTANVAQ